MKDKSMPIPQEYESLLSFLFGKSNHQANPSAKMSAGSKLLIILIEVPN